MTGKEVTGRLVKDIMAGAYSDDGRLPSEAKLADEFGVSRMTLRGALDELRRQGLIEKRNGSGSFLTKRGLRRSGLIGLVIPEYEAYGFFNEIKEEKDTPKGLDTALRSSSPRNGNAKPLCATCGANYGNSQWPAQKA